VALEIPPDFGRDRRAVDPVEIGVWVDGACLSGRKRRAGLRAGPARGFLAQKAARCTARAGRQPPRLDMRYRYNQDFQSVYAMVPAVIPLLLTFIPAILTAVGVVREKELGSITNLYVTPVSGWNSCSASRLPTSCSA
jgi:ribosome-dependent ATPase